MIKKFSAEISLGGLVLDVVYDGQRLRMTSRGDFTSAADAMAAIARAHHNVSDRSPAATEEPVKAAMVIDRERSLAAGAPALAQFGLHADPVVDLDIFVGRLEEAAAIAAADSPAGRSTRLGALAASVRAASQFRIPEGAPHEMVKGTIARLNRVRDFVNQASAEAGAPPDAAPTRPLKPVRSVKVGKVPDTLDQNSPTGASAVDALAVTADAPVPVDSASPPKAIVDAVRISDVLKELHAMGWAGLAEQQSACRTLRAAVPVLAAIEAEALDERVAVVHGRIWGAVPATGS